MNKSQDKSIGELTKVDTSSFSFKFNKKAMINIAISNLILFDNSSWDYRSMNVPVDKKYSKYSRKRRLDFLFNTSKIENLGLTDEFNVAVDKAKEGKFKPIKRIMRNNPDEFILAKNENIGSAVDTDKADVFNAIVKYLVLKSEIKN